MAMFRTRDFILIFTMVVFLLLAIGSTKLMQSSSSQSAAEPIKFAESSDRDYSAEVESDHPISREDRLADMRRRIAESGELAFSAPEMQSEEADVGELQVVDEEESQEQDSTTLLDNVVQQCPVYSDFAGVWPVGVQVDSPEGARIAYIEQEVEYELPPATPTSTSVVETRTERQVLAQLSGYPVITATANCIASDVIGIAQEGSLIRNNEAGLYSVFGSNTIVGYALDGFPIYGLSSEVGDECGGSVVDGQYGYYLSFDRDVILNCFKAQPINL